MEKKCKVVMLVTNPNDETSKGIWVAKDRNWCHLFILSDEEIKKKEWLYDEFGLRQARWDTNGIGTKPTDGNNQYKVIATTDSTLNLPLIPESFIALYIEKYNKGNVIDRMLVEYDIIQKTTYEEATASDGGYYNRPIITETEKLKINPSDNTISIQRKKESWTREEVISEIKKINNVWSSLLTARNANLENDINDWVEENL